MLVLDDTYASPEVLSFLEESQEPVFDNLSAHRFVEQGRALSIADNKAVSQGRIIALSEAYLEDVKRHCSSQAAEAIALCKDKAACRRALKPLYPNYVFEEYSFDQFPSVDVSTFELPVVLKPSTGFFSLGIYPIFSVEDWDAALLDIQAHSTDWSTNYGSTVVNNTKFLVESYLEGEEYAIDAYFNEQGETVILNILKHDFAGSDDVSDRLYYTSKQVIQENLGRMQSFLEQCNEIFGLKNFPVHVEVRVDDAGMIIPIEFNPLRFAGLCTTDISYFAYGFKTYELYLRNEAPNWDEILASKDGLRYSAIILSTDGNALSDSYSFDFGNLKQHFSKVLTTRVFDAKKYNLFGMLFVETPEEQAQKEAQFILNADLNEFLS